MSRLTSWKKTLCSVRSMVNSRGVKQDTKVLPSCTQTHTTWIRKYMTWPHITIVLWNRNTLYQAVYIILKLPGTLIEEKKTKPFWCITISWQLYVVTWYIYNICFLTVNNLRAVYLHPAVRCGLSIWLSLLAIFNTIFWIDTNFYFHEVTDKTREYSKSAIFVWYKNGRRQLQGAQSINTDGATLHTRHYNNQNSDIFINFMSDKMRIPSEQSACLPAGAVTGVSARERKTKLSKMLTTKQLRVTQSWPMAKRHLK